MRRHFLLQVLEKLTVVARFSALQRICRSVFELVFKLGLVMKHRKTLMMKNLKMNLLL